MEPFLADLINNKKVPKFIRFIIIIIMVGFIEYISIDTVISSPYLWGKIFGIILSITFIIIFIILIFRIYKK